MGFPTKYKKKSRFQKQSIGRIKIHKIKIQNEKYLPFPTESMSSRTRRFGEQSAHIIRRQRLQLLRRLKKENSREQLIQRV